MQQRGAMEGSRKTQPQFLSQTHTVWLLLLSLSIAAADSVTDKTQLPSKDRALKGRGEKMVVAVKHAVNGNPTVEPFPEGMETIMFGMGCFWGAERLFWQLPGVFSTQVGYAGGFTPNPTYHEVCTGMRQQNDHGTQYRSAIYTSNPTQQEFALKSKAAFQQELTEKGFGPITTEILMGQQFYYAEDYHQQYLKKEPNGYCGLKRTGVSCPIGAGKDEL
ncbi:mitochondrial peptide methionine sulfoxide reductase isoform X2 [Channa argus]|uniref:mitochondrial peptide methionine sulfoxide reductase isoform X2 n=1 Tax=Channa argus TaxID=215402 RepID=UPI0035214BF7